MPDIFDICLYFRLAVRAGEGFLTQWHAFTR